MLPQKYALGVDIGATKIKAALVDSSGGVFKSKQIPANAEAGPKDIEKRLIEMLKSLCEGVCPVGIGVGIAGQIEPQSGLVLFAPNLNWRHVSLKDTLSTVFHLPVVVIGDVKAAALGEWSFGAGKGYRNLVCLFVGTGVGGGMIIDNQLVEGASNTAGEWGHMIIDLNGPQCTCGNFGCLEAYAGGWAIARNAREAVLADPFLGKPLLVSCGGDFKKITAKIVSETASAGDDLSQQILQKAVDAIVVGCVNIVNALNPALLILGGGVTKGMPDLLAQVRKGIELRALDAAKTSLKVVSAQLHEDAVVIGAAARVFKKGER